MGDESCISVKTKGLFSVDQDFGEMLSLEANYELEAGLDGKSVIDVAIRIRQKKGDLSFCCRMCTKQQSRSKLLEARSPESLGHYQVSPRAINLMHAETAISNLN